MLKFIATKLLGPKLIRLAIITFFIFLLIAAFTPVVNTQNPYPSLNFPKFIYYFQ